MFELYGDAAQIFQGNFLSTHPIILRLLRKIRESGVTILLVEHHTRLVMALADRVTVLSAGSVIADGPPNVVQRDAGVIASYLGDGA